MKGRYEGLLPDKFKEVNPGSISMKDGFDIIGRTCPYCLNEPDCKIRDSVAQAMGDNYHYWSSKHFFLQRLWGMSHFPFCDEFESPQLELFGSELSPGVEHAVKMMSIAEKESDRRWDSRFDNEPDRPTYTLIRD